MAIAGREGIAGVAVGQSGLTKNRVLKTKLAFVVLNDARRCLNQAVLHRLGRLVFFGAVRSFSIAGPKGSGSRVTRHPAYAVTFQREQQDVVAVGAFGASISFPQGNQIRHRGSMTGARIIAQANRAVCGRVRLVQL